MVNPLTPPPVGRNPDTLFLIGLLMLAGLGQLVSGAESGTVEELVPPWLLYAWSATMTGGSALILAGVLWPRSRVTGLLVEAVGRVMLAPTALAYALAVADVGGFDAALLVALVLGLAMASVWRAWQIRQTIRHVSRSLAAISVEQDQDR